MKTTTTATPSRIAARFGVTVRPSAGAWLIVNADGSEAAAKQIAIGYEKAAMSAAGQRAMCDDASSRATAFNLAAFLRRRNVPTYDDAFIASANAITLAAIKDELVADYNKAITQGHSALHGT